MQRRNNIILGFILCAMAFMIAIPLHWFDIVPGKTPGEMPFRVAPTTGINGSVGLLFSVPIWLLLVLCAVGACVSITNLLQLTSIFKWVLVGLYLFSALHFVWILLPNDRIKIDAPPVIVTIASAAAIVLLLVDPKTRTQPS